MLGVCEDFAAFPFTFEYGGIVIIGTPSVDGILSVDVRIVGYGPNVVDVVSEPLTLDLSFEENVVLGGILGVLVV